ncbi:MAG: ChbG/HpnK family deacetylase [Chitinivibrionales bacterium]|nr:ChbG/HpnK family deacetylase [Chitinivibrionales bacterium]
MAEPRIKLVTKGDDLGSCHSANLAFEEAYKKGQLKNAVIMPICPDIVEAAQLLAGEKGLCIGLHSSMNAEWDSRKWKPVSPVEKVPSLVDDDGYLFQTCDRLFHRPFDFGEVFIELQAQLDYGRELGFDIKFADAHCGWTWILKEREDEFGKWCDRNGLMRRPKVNRLPDVACDGDPVEKLIARLEAAEPGTYIVGGHPGYDNEEMRGLGHPGYPGDQVATEREWERRIHTDPRILEYCRNSGVVPVRFDEL